jgi:hypothetical protein
MSKRSAAFVLSVFAAAGGLCRLPTYAQVAQQPTAAERFVARLLQNRYGLSLRGGRLFGTGANVLQTGIAEARFVLLGEDHGLAETPELGAAVCNAAGSDGFTAIAVEEGPLAATALEGWARRQDGLADLRSFVRTSPESLAIYRTRQEFEMLQSCARAGAGEWHLWGLNQEAYGAGGLILSRILERGVGEQARQAIRQLVQKNEDASRKALQSGRIFDLFMMSADDAELGRAAAILQKDGSAEARSLFASLIESHEIDRRPPVEYANIRRRERLMKTRFAENYTRAATAAAAPPKVLLKFGAYHVYRGWNPVHGSGIGNYVAEFAEGQRAQSLHIRLIAVKGAQPIYPRVGQPAELIQFNLRDQPGSRYLEPMFANMLPQDWTMFDLRPLRPDARALGGEISADLAALVFGIDILVIVPEGSPSTE